MCGGGQHLYLFQIEGMACTGILLLVYTCVSICEDTHSFWYFVCNIIRSCMEQMAKS
jgi:hypothetical protein